MCALPEPQAQHAAEENQPSEHISNLTRTAMPQGSMDPNTSDQLPLAEQTSSQLQTPPDPLRTRIIYTREELLALRSSGLTLDLHVPTELIQGRRRRRGCRGGKKRKLWAQQRQAKGLLEVPCIYLPIEYLYAFCIYYHMLNAVHFWRL